MTDQDLKPSTLGQLLDQAVAAHPDNDAIIYVDRDFRLTYREFGALVDRLAKGLMALGVAKNEKVAVWATNVPYWVALQFATAKIGAILLTVNTNYKSAELDYLLRQSEAENIFIIEGFRDTDYVQTLYDLVPELKTQERGYLKSKAYPHLKRVCFLGPEKHRGMYAIPEILALDAMVDEAAYQARQDCLDPHETVNMQYTSGTTGFPKGVMLTHHNIGNNGYWIGENQHFTPDTGELLGPGEQGEVCCRGYNVMKGYYNMPEATAETIDAEGWLHSGDLGVMDKDGYLAITGRHKDMIIRGGENIYPREIEEFLYRMDGIADVQVAGVRSAKYGEEVGAFIILKDGHTYQPEDIRDFCRGRISHYKIPKYVAFVNDYPMTASGKIQKFKLREMAEALFPDRI